MPASLLPELKGIPSYDDPALYLSLGDRSIPWEFEGWKPESLSWKTGCYIHAGLSNYQVHFEGPGALDFWESVCVNSFAKFPIGSMKHAVMCTEAGLIASHAILQRNGEQEFRLFAAGFPWAEHMAAISRFDVQVRHVPSYLHQVAGPTSLDTLERATGESLRDIGFLQFRSATIAGFAVEIGRIGMSGNLAFEVRGPIEEGACVYDAIFRAGVDLGIQRLGWRTYFVNHIEGGFPQAGWTFFTAGIEDPAFRDRMSSRTRSAIKITGSVDPVDMRSRFRSPLEVGWGRTVRFDHSFVGRAALEAEAANPRRTVVTLRWNAEDVLDIHASHLRPGEEYKAIDMPTTPSWQHGFFAHADHVLLDGRTVGISSGTIYSYYFREVLSMATIDLDCAGIGTEVIVQWGEHGRRIKDVRATVERFPYLAEGRNDQVDTAALPAGAVAG
jgi:glycine cleavage system aminomethyltransferase T